MPTKPMTNVMVDLETLGNRPGCVVLSIGAVFFDPDTGELGREFYKVLRQMTCEAVGMHVNEDTEKWWKSQSKEAQAVLRQAMSVRGSKEGDHVLRMFNEFLVPGYSGKKSRTLKVWGNGADFDCTILIEAYRLFGMEHPWEFWNHRCHRTLKNLMPEVKIERSGTHHNALDDAKTQAEHACALFARLREKLA